MDYIQYPLGLSLMGHDVYYFEDTMLYPVYQENETAWDDASGVVNYLKETMEYFGLANRWAYRDIATGKCFGMSLEKVLDICKTADIFINLSCSTVMRDEYYKIPNRVLVDTDPMFTQVQYYKEVQGPEETSTQQMLKGHNYLFSFGENIGKPGCRIPVFDFDWKTTRQPVCIDLWSTGIFDQAVQTFTSVLNWSARKDLEYDNETWGQKDIEFMKYLELPLSIPDVRFEVVINPPTNTESSYDAGLIRSKKWNIIDPRQRVAKYNDYISFIKGSFAEFCIAKETYVKSYSGWFSCRSACYLAAGKPVVAQETGWSEYIPTGKGLLSFRDNNSAIECVEEILRDSKKHTRAAKEIAIEYFDSKKVLNDLLDKLS